MNFKEWLKLIEYKAIVPSSGLLDHFKNAIAPQMFNLTKVAQNPMQLAQALNNIFARRPFQQAKISFNVNPQDQYEQPFVQGTVNNGNIQLTIGRVGMQAFANQDLNTILGGVRSLVGHEDTHVSQFKNTNSKMYQTLQGAGHDKHWGPLQNINTGTAVAQMYDNPSQVDPQVRKLISQRYFINTSELPSHAYSAVADLINQTKKINPQFNPQQVKQQVSQLVARLEANPQDPAIIQMSPNLKVYAQVVALDFPKSLPSFIKIMKQTINQMGNEWF